MVVSGKHGQTTGFGENGADTNMLGAWRPRRPWKSQLAVLWHQQRRTQHAKRRMGSASMQLRSAPRVRFSKYPVSAFCRLSLVSGPQSLVSCLYKRPLSLFAGGSTQCSATSGQLHNCWQGTRISSLPPSSVYLPLATCNTVYTRVALV